MNIYPTYEEFKKMSEKGNVIPVYTKLLADVETPITAFMKIAKDEEYSFLLESVAGEDKFSRYTFLGADPYMKIKSQNGKIYTEKSGKVEEKEIESGKDPLDYLKEIMDSYNPVNVEGLPPFFGGAVGYFAYDIVRYFEELPNENPDVLDVPDMYYIFTDTIVVFDRFKQELLIICNVMKDEVEDLEVAYREAVSKIEKFYNKLKEKLEDPYIKIVDKEYKIESNFTESEFSESVVKAKEYIKSGDIFQVVLSQRFFTDYTGDTFDAYRKLRSINPSPYMFYLDFKEFQIAGASPEIQVKLEDGMITLRPIAGTRKRGKTREEDLALEKELLADEKEVAEHVTLIDLGRNDVGRMSEYGSVKLSERMIIERYSHVMHIVSSVQGKLKADKDGYDLIRATFPAGTLSGAPKIRAMEIIEELEPDRRGVYGGAVSYFSFNGDLDSCITIRTILFKDGKAYMQAGAGIVYDSVPKNEFKETENKIAAVIKALK